MKFVSELIYFCEKDINALCGAFKVTFFYIPILFQAVKSESYFLFTEAR